MPQNRARQSGAVATTEVHDEFVSRTDEGESRYCHRVMWRIAESRRSVPRSDWFDYPVGPPSGRGYYVARRFREERHLGEDWNGVGGGNSDLGDPVFAIASGEVEFAVSPDAAGAMSCASSTRSTVAPSRPCMRTSIR